MALPPPRYCLPAAYREEDLMPSRGSAQFLLLFLRSRRRLGWMMGALACALIVAVLLQAGGEFPSSEPHRARATAAPERLAACSRRVAGSPAFALGRQPRQHRRKVPLLGLSASVIKETNPGQATANPVGGARIRICRAPSSARLASATISPSPRLTAPRAIIASPGARWSIRIWPISRGRRIWMRR